MLIELTVNGFKHEIQCAPDEYLSDSLRQLGYLSVRQGCDTGSCGACTVHINGMAILSCITLAAQAHGKSITTIEGVPMQAKAIGTLLVEEGADQCGYCSSGLIMSILYLESVVSAPTDEDIRKYLNGNLCRCTGYAGQFRAVKRYFEVKAHENC